MKRIDQKYHIISITVLLMVIMVITALKASAININLDVKRNGFYSKPDTAKELRTYTYQSINNFNNFKVEFKGYIVITPNEDDIESISPDGYLKIEKSTFGNERKIEILSDKNGNLTKKYFEGKTEKDFATAGKEQLATILPEVIRTTGISAREQVMRIYKEKGVQGVLAEIEAMKHSYSGSYSSFYFVYYEKTSSGTNVKNLYTKILIDEIPLNKSELKDVLEVIQTIASNSTRGVLLRNILNKYTIDEELSEEFFETLNTLEYNTERGNTLRAFQKKYKITAANRDNFFEVIENMSINSEKGNVLKPLLMSQKLDNKTMVRLLESLHSFSSNSERLAVLRTALPYIGNSTEVVEAFMYAIKDVHEAYYIPKDELLMAIASKNPNENELKQDKTILIGLLENAERYSSNVKRSELLRKVNLVFMNDADFLDAYFDVIEGMSDQMERYNVLLHLLNHQKLEKESLEALLEAAEELAEEDYKHAASAILRASIQQLPEDDGLFDDFFDVLDEIDHDSGKEEICRMLCEKGSLSKRTIIQIIKVSDDIEVDIERASVLMEVKKVMPKNDSEIQFVFETYAKQIESFYEYEKVMN